MYGAWEERPSGANEVNVEATEAKPEKKSKKEKKAKLALVEAQPAVEAKPAEPAKEPEAKEEAKPAWNVAVINGLLIGAASAAMKAAQGDATDGQALVRLLGDDGLNVQVGRVPGLFVELNVAAETLDFGPVFVRADKLYESVAEEAHDKITRMKVEGEELVLLIGKKEVRLAMEKPEKFVKPLLGDDEEVEASADVVYPAEQLGRAIHWAAGAQVGAGPAGVAFDGLTLLGVGEVKLHTAALPVAFGGEWKNRPPVLPTLAAELLVDLIGRLDVKDVPVCLMEIPRKGDYFAIQLGSEMIGAAIVAKGTGEKVPEYRNRLPEQGRAAAVGSLDCQKLFRALTPAVEIGAKLARLHLMQGSLRIEAVGEGAICETIRVERSGSQDEGGLFIEAFSWVDVASLKETLGRLLQHEEVTLSFPVETGLLAVVGADGKVGTLMPVTPAEGEEEKLQKAATERAELAERERKAKKAAEAPEPPKPEPVKEEPKKPAPEQKKVRAAKPAKKK
jgi:hypothetical protein